ncbi:MAG: DUF3810 domain-containing protein [Bacteroidetes bacterium]|nr:DUF3810 domain-containing protein [Bacteroidota bacterium]
MEYLKKWIWIILAVIVISLRLILNGNPEIIETWYSRGIFIGIRYLVDYSIALLPVPLIYLFFVVLFVAVLRGFFIFFRSKKLLFQKLAKTFFALSSFSACIIFLFLLLWGFNYGRVPIDKQLGLDLKPLNINELENEMRSAAKLTIKYRDAINEKSELAISDIESPKNLENEIRKSLKKVLQMHGFPVQGRVRVRQLVPKGIFLRFSSSGLYFPWVGEGNIDAGIYHLQKPFVMAHEMAHGFGFSDEGTCNFIAYLACLESDDPFVRYSGQLSFYRYVASNYLKYRSENYNIFRASLPKGLQADLNAINTNLAKYPDIMPKLRYAAYDTYLKTQGIPEGIANYDRVIMMVKAWREQLKG